MSTGVSQVLIEGVPRRFFGDFLIVQKVTPRPPAAQGRPYKIFSHAITFLRAQKGNEVSHKVLLPTFLSRKVGQARLNCFSNSFRVSSMATGRP